MPKRISVYAAALSVSVFGIACSSSKPVDPVASFPNHYAVLLENDAVRVLKITYQPGEKTAMHHHPEGLVIALTGSKTKFGLPDGTSQEVEVPTDGGNYMPAGDHSPENVGSVGLDAILVEFKRPQPGMANLPTSMEGRTMTVLAEGPYASAYKVTSGPTAEEPAGTTHEYDQVIIALAPAEVSLSIDGQAPKTSWARGDVAFIGRGTPHASKHLSEGTAEYAVVLIK